SGSMGRSPAVALTSARAATAAMHLAIASGASAPRAPLAGSFKSTMSAPAWSARLASPASRTLARNRVMSARAACLAWRLGSEVGARAAGWLRASAEQPAEHAAATAAAAAAPRPATAGTASLAAVCRARLSAKAPEIAGLGRGLTPRFTQLDFVGVAVGVGYHHRDRLPIPLRSDRAPALRLDRDHLVRPRVDDRHIFEAVMLAVAGVASVVLEQADAGKRVLQQLPLEDPRPPRAEHLELDPERRIFVVARDVAVGRRLLDHPALLGRPERLSRLLRHLNLEALQRFTALGLERVLRESGAVVGDALVGAVKRLVDIAPDSQRERIGGRDLERLI